MKQMNNVQAYLFLVHIVAQVMRIVFSLDKVSEAGTQRRILFIRGPQSILEVEVRVKTIFQSI